MKWAVLLFAADITALLLLLGYIWYDYRRRQGRRPQ